ncbi:MULTISPECIES: hypothetical protein [Corynebacterium]|uniref:Uncharacterized protein n=2 Tax=Corynebacterium TaxID=1716 RepID=A0A2N6TQC5_9CORY|nr:MULTISPECIES: hypothetical protein [Corynebacterium]KKO77697.1 membrane protein [Corynebacterium minutissimum]MTD90548.1 hypothetical protein [Corynebacterium aurimucosum]OFK65474.1 hypothetical protein HMPREF2806_11700 [Corynebacterium sp. HMSC076G08]OFK66800.1 hypothetical protein HMPREF2807_08445 [Corynebacterium sp. HMSC074A09]OFN35426.1 hypothetical protein HMPREF2565_07035 [Corynebacterium sp. HMSC072A04]
MSKNPETNPTTDGVDIPAALRVGGAFMLLAAVLALFGLVSIFTDGWGATFEWTWRRLAIVGAALLVGAFSTQRRDQRGSREQIIALVLALVLIIASRALPNTVLTTMGQYVVFLYAVAAGLCAVIIRRTLR